MRSRIFHPGSHTATASLGLLILRASIGPMLAVGHGWGKLLDFAESAASFPDPLGIGHKTSMACTIGAELVCSVLVTLGFATRLTALPVAFTMGVAVSMVHANDPWGKKEFALLYLIPFLVLAFTGAGKYSLDALGGHSAFSSNSPSYPSRRHHRAV